jgi:hypothetical protein
VSVAKSVLSGADAVHETALSDEAANWMSRSVDPCDHATAQPPAPSVASRGSPGAPPFPSTTGADHTVPLAEVWICTGPRKPFWYATAHVPMPQAISGQQRFAGAAAIVTGMDQESPAFVDTTASSSCWSPFLNQVATQVPRPSVATRG